MNQRILLVVLSLLAAHPVLARARFDKSQLIKITAASVQENLNLTMNDGDSSITVYAPGNDPSGFDPGTVDMGVSYDVAAKALCGDFNWADPANAAVLQRQADTRQVLMDIMIRLQGTPAPRKLSAAEETKLEQVPVCEPFYTEERMITQLLREKKHGFKIDDRLAEARLHFGNDADTGVMDILVGKSNATFKLYHKVELNPKGLPLKLDALEGEVGKTGQEDGLRIKLVSSDPANCTSSYRLVFVNSQMGESATLTFTVDETEGKRCH